jgi:hypothetical protein
VKRGVTQTAAAIGVALTANSVQAAPVGLAATVTATAAKSAGISATISTLVKGTMKLMTWVKIKFVAGVGTAALLVGGVVTVALSDSRNTQVEAIQILKQSQAKYDSLSSYSDSGSFIRDINGKMFTNALSVLLERTNFYRIDWQELADTNGKLEVRAYPSERLHAKLYVMTFVDGHIDKGARHNRL